MPPQNYTERLGPLANGHEGSPYPAELSKMVEAAFTSPRQLINARAAIDTELSANPSPERSHTLRAYERALHSASRETALSKLFGAAQNTRTAKLLEAYDAASGLMFQHSQQKGNIVDEQRARQQVGHGYAVMIECSSLAARTSAYKWSEKIVVPRGGMTDIYLLELVQKENANSATLRQATWGNTEINGTLTPQDDLPHITIDSRSGFALDRGHHVSPEAASDFIDGLDYAYNNHYVWVPRFGLDAQFENIEF